MVDSTTPSIEALHMVQIRFNLVELLGKRAAHGLPTRGRGDVDDVGYLVHCQLRALFGERTPQPFLPRVVGRRVDVLGYSVHDADALREALDFAEPRWGTALEIESREMPGTSARPWPFGRRYGYTVRVCPLVRGIREVDGETKKWERDAYQREAEKAEARAKAAGRPTAEELPSGRREEVYGEWLAASFGRVGAASTGAALVGAARLESFRLVRLLRRTHAVQRQARTMTRPDATLAGELEVVDGDAFTRFLAHGVGRHKAFGFGMLRLRPL
ncbi:MAG: type I-E CRISPR-associated protein Cas6/Cse3/CasE [Acidobacteriota bacterium]